MPLAQGGPVTQEARQFFKLTATIPDQPNQPATSGVLTLASSPVGVMSDDLSRGESGLAFPLIGADVFVGVAVTNANEPGSGGAACGSRSTRSTGDCGAVRCRASVLAPKCVTGALEGERFDVDEAATGSAAPGALVR